MCVVIKNIEYQFVIADVHSAGLFTTNEPNHSSASAKTQPFDPTALLVFIYLLCSDNGCSI